MDKSTGLDIPHCDRRTFSVHAEEDRAIWRACHRLDRMWETQREPQDTCDRVVDANGTIIAALPRPMVVMHVKPPGAPLIARKVDPQLSERP